MRRGNRPDDPESNKTPLILSLVVLLLAMVALGMGEDRVKELIPIEITK